MNKSITLRNLAGGFLGGLLGILVSWYMAPMALPFGVLLGVIVGWWADDIVQMFIRSVRSAVGIWKYREQSKVLLHSWLNHYGALVSTATRGIVMVTRYIVILPSLLFMWPFLLIRRCRRWVAMHPTRTALLTTISAIVVGAIINVLVFVILWPCPEMKTVGSGVHNNPKQLVLFMSLYIVVIMGLLTLFMMIFDLLCLLLEDGDRAMRNFYIRWERYSPLIYFTRELFRFFQLEAMLAVFVALMTVYWVTLGGVLIALVMIPVVTFVTFMVNLYKIAQRSAHWWCFGVTLAMTSISALVFYDSFGNEVVLWEVALCTGFASGVSTEGLCRLGLWWINTETGQHYLEIWSSKDKILLFCIATPVWRTLSQVFLNLIEPFQTRFNKICYITHD